MIHDAIRIPAMLRHAALALLVAAASAFSADAGAVGTRTFTLDTLDDFKGGDLTGVAIDSAGNGRVELAAKTGAMAVSSMAIGWNGDVFLGTFPDGKIFKIAANASGGAQATV